MARVPDDARDIDNNDHGFVIAAPDGNETFIPRADQAGVTNNLDDWGPIVDFSSFFTASTPATTRF